jgi:hypothetical protein
MMTSKLRALRPAKGDTISNMHAAMATRQAMPSTEMCPARLDRLLYVPSIKMTKGYQMVSKQHGLRRSCIFFDRHSL